MRESRRDIRLKEALERAPDTHDIPKRDSSSPVSASRQSVERSTGWGTGR